jgi:transcriptional regulator with XRE-family HTH domain
MFTLPSLRRLRLKRLITQADLAEMTGLTKATLSRIENGQPARISTIRKLSVALRVEPDELMAPEPDQGHDKAAA